jgi:hypothetical protein
LICAFAAVEGAEILADDGFAGEGDVIGGGDQVEIDAANYYDWFAHFLGRLRVNDSRKTHRTSVAEIVAATSVVSATPMAH